MNELIVHGPTDLAACHTSEQIEITATRMAREFCEATAEIERLMTAIGDQCKRLDDLFHQEEEGEGRHYYSTFNLTFAYDGQSRYNHDDGPKIVERMRRHAWRMIVNRLGLTAIMSVQRKKEFDQQLERGEVPELTEQAITGILLGLVGQVGDFAREAAKEVFDMLRPRRSGYKTNETFRVGRRIILVNHVEKGYGSVFRPTHYRQQYLIAIDGTFHLLAGKGPLQNHPGPLCDAINATLDGRGETEFFKFRCFKNGNLHLEMRRLDLVKELNLLAAGEYVLGQDQE